MKSTANYDERVLDNLNNKLQRLMNEPIERVNDIDECLRLIKEAQANRDLSRLKDQIKKYNKEEGEKREFLRALKSLSLPCEDITNNDGSFHATKLKKVDGLSAFVDRFRSVRLVWNEEVQAYTNAKWYGKDFRILLPVYGGYGEKDTFKPFVNELEMFEHNGIEPKDLVLSKVLRSIEKIEQEREKVLRAIEKHDKVTEKFGKYSLSKAGIIQQANDRVNTYMRYK